MGELKKLFPFSHKQWIPGWQQNPFVFGKTGRHGVIFSWSRAELLETTPKVGLQLTTGAPSRFFCWGSISMKWLHGTIQTAKKMNQHVSYLVGHSPSHWLPLSWKPENNCSHTWTLDCLVEDHLPEGWGTLLDSNDGQRTRTSIWDRYLASHNQLGHWNITQTCSWNILVTRDFSIFPLPGVPAGRRVKC